MGNLIVTLKFLALVFGLTLNYAFAQIDSTKLFTESKGHWEYPLKHITEIVALKDKKYDCFSDPLKSILFYSDKSVEVKSIHEGRVVSIAEVDSTEIVIIKFGNYFLTYVGLTHVCVSKGDYIGSGQQIGNLAKDYDDRFRLEVYLHTYTTELDPAFWFKEESCP